MTSKTNSLILLFLFGIGFTLHLQIPHSLFKEEGYEHREALFGTPPYGGSIAQTVYYADSDLCDQNVDPTKGWPQRDNNEPWPSPFILMVDRGSCTFVKKVRFFFFFFLFGRNWQSFGDYYFACCCCCFFPHVCDLFSFCLKFLGPQRSACRSCRGYYCG